MAKRGNHYEAAFEEYLRSRQIPYVAVDEKKRALLGGGSLKSLDFIVSPVVGGSWLVDVKGRRFPAGAGQQKQYWKNWSTRDDVRSLGAWQQLFGAGSQALFVFAYEIVGDRAPLAADRLFEYGGRLYAFIGIRLDDYAAAARPLSVKWDTLAMNVGRFRSLAADVAEFFDRASAGFLSGRAVAHRSLIGPAILPRPIWRWYQRAGSVGRMNPRAIANLSD